MTSDKRDVFDDVFDPGLQPERTLLAWRRTCLGVAVGVTALVRFSLVDNTATSLGLGLIGLATIGGAWVATGARYRRTHQSLVGGAGLAGGGAVSATAGAMTVLIVLALLVTVRIG
jgi:uncharacterized membrane protein YidH (DUF202 family)